jgi:hypothetical protein
MTAAVVTIAETNGVGASTTNSISNTNMGSYDDKNLTAATYPITAGSNSFEKWQRFYLQNKNAASSIKNLKVWASAALNSGATHYTNARTTGWVNTSYVQPVATASSYATQIMPTGDSVTPPATANVGIGGSLSGALTSDGTYSDYIISQIQTTGVASAGSTVTMYFQYDETT